MDAVLLILSLLLLASPILMAQSSGSGCSSATKETDEIVAAHVARAIALNAAHPDAAWTRAQAATFCADWQGKSADPGRQTSVRALWSREHLYLRFECRYREIYVFDDAGPNGRRDQLWDRDVAEAFLQPDPSQPRHYKEFEVSPNGFWIGLDISPAGGVNLKSGLQRSVWLDKANRVWVAELAIPLKALAGNFDPNAVWRVNFFRVEGPEPRRFYSAWRATHTPEPNFHVPAAFGKLRFAAGS